MIVNIPADEAGHYTAPPFSKLPIKVQIQDNGEWKDYGSIKYTGHVAILYGEATYRFSIASNGPDCCVEYTETDVVDASPRILIKPVGPVITTFIPIETSPDWETVGGSNPTQVNLIEGVVTQVGNTDPEQAIAFRDYNLVDVEVSCIIHHENPSNDIKSFFLTARMSSVDDAIGLRGYNGVIEIYERIDGAFQSLLVATPSNSGTIGTRMALRVVGTQASAIVDGVEYIAETPTAITSAGRVGFLGRGSSLGDTPLASDYMVTEL